MWTLLLATQVDAVITVAVYTTPKANAKEALHELLKAISEHCSLMFFLIIAGDFIQANLKTVLPKLLYRGLYTLDRH